MTSPNLNSDHIVIRQNDVYSMVKFGKKKGQGGYELPLVNVKLLRELLDQSDMIPDKGTMGALNAVNEALKRNGCFMMQSTREQDDVHNAMKEYVRQFVALPQEEKEKSDFHTLPIFHSGYYPLGSESTGKLAKMVNDKESTPGKVKSLSSSSKNLMAEQGYTADESVNPAEPDFKEAYVALGFDFMDVRSHRWVMKLCQPYLLGKHWPDPDMLPGFKDAFWAHYQVNMSFIRQVLEIMRVAAGITGTYPCRDDVVHDKHGRSLVQANMYPEVKRGESTSLAMVEHFDICWSTLLYRELGDSSSSAQVWDPVTKNYYEIPNIGSPAISFFLGIRGYLFLNGLYRPTLHRVLKTPGPPSTSTLLSYNPTYNKAFPPEVTEEIKRMGKLGKPLISCNDF